MNRLNKKITVGLVTLTLAGVNLVVANEMSSTVEASGHSVVRLQGNDRYETASIISQESYETADTVVIASAMTFADALAGVPLAYQNEAPILLAYGNSLRQTIISEINRLGAQKAIILGGEAVISNQIETELKGLGLTTTRLAGDDRFETAALIATEVNGLTPSDQAVVVNGFEFADAMSVAPFAAREGMPILLTRSNRLTDTKILEDYDSTYIIGGPSAVSLAVEAGLNNPLRIQGSNRYQTNMEVMKYFGTSSTDLYLATGSDFADALTGSVLAATDSSGVILVKDKLTDEAKAFVDQQAFTQFTVLGGEAAVPETFIQGLNEYLDNRNLDISNETLSVLNFDQMKALMQEHVNTLRQEVGVDTLTVNAVLSEAADKRSYESKPLFSHTRPDGSMFNTIFYEDSYAYNYRAVGENLAMRTMDLETEEEVSVTEKLFLQWKNSPGHYANMISELFTEIGMGFYYEDNAIYATQLFGKPMD